MPELRRLSLQGKEWIVFQDVCDVLSIAHPHLAIGMVPLAHRTQSTVVAADGTRRYEWLIDDIGANSLAAQQDRRSTMNQRKRRTRAVQPGEESNPTPQRRSRVKADAEPRERTRRRITGSTATYTEASSVPAYTTEETPDADA